MPSHRQPNSLEGLSLGRVCQQLGEMCQRLQVLSQQSSAAQVLVFAKQTIRSYYISGLPIHLRFQIIERTLRMLNPSVVGLTFISAPAVIYVLALLLNNDIKQLKINLCCYYGCSHQTSLLKLLASEGIGLESLDLTRSSLLSLDCELLHSALLNMKNLSNLTLRNIANDAVLEVIGKSCPKLVVLDIACSKQVTNAGLKQLLFQTELRDKVRSVSPQKHTTWSRLKRLFNMWEVKSSKSKKRFHSEKVLPFMEYKNRNLLCDTLKVLNVANTAVTNLGVLLALMQIPQLESLAEYNHMEHVAEIMHQIIDLKVPFNLTEIRSRKTTSFNIKLLAQICPKVKKLYINEPHHSFDTLRFFPYITSLSVHNVPPEKEWLNGFYNYLRTNGQNLSELNIQMVQSQNPLQVDLKEILSNCPNLHTLIKNGSNIVWTKGCDPPPFKYLKKIQLGHTVKALVITKVLLLAPELTTLHVHSCLDLTNEYLEKLLKPPIKSNRELDKCDNNLQNLTCFFISEASKVSATVVLNMLHSYRRLKWFGNLANWDLESEDIEMLRTTIDRKNMNVDLCPDSHWYWNNCVQWYIKFDTS